MSFRIVYISSQAHLSFKNNYLVLRGENIKQIHLSEINTILIDNNSSSLSVYLLNELIKNKIKVIVCDENHNPNFEMMPYNASYETPKMIMRQIRADLDVCDKLWQKIVQYKITYQAKNLKLLGLDDSALSNYVNEVQIGDLTNREGHAAKVYFNKLFGKGFSREQDNTINKMLNYGYTILLSSFNKSIVAHGYITQIGIHHKGPFNPYNLACDLMEPFRPIIDMFVCNNIDREFDSEIKFKIIDLLNSKVKYRNKLCYLSDVIDQYTVNILSFFENNTINEDWFLYNYE